MQRVFMVFKNVKGVPTLVGNVYADSQYTADRKARNLFGFGAWAKDKEAVAA